MTRQHDKSGNQARKKEMKPEERELSNQTSRKFLIFPLEFNASTSLSFNLVQFTAVQLVGLLRAAQDRKQRVCGVIRLCAARRTAACVLCAAQE